ncbi:uncharacterized protein KNAG_0G03020 [Huiozyma naganishii CBS 8797]|uniref:Uncharacterized protein n=1 Tax=Huiozyma naganishii (strain ATCC MYA-139 / BCRC 22969 / CBS 8797 / KCTC 17520 / NBRC 10181 / NCYC 3082 / Yp74L-3) TaxID=1071383 RepID=J7S855_HUIN7|nr:hypothetical protein KNAG_0G03020 [Kazachstania naganishii CBS 8797]CCK71359.1 hypothetical protein KNAG_0G03020 [Kazachstania naganishii CBS 8797]
MVGLSGSQQNVSIPYSHGAETDVGLTGPISLGGYDEAGSIRKRLMRIGERVRAYEVKVLNSKAYKITVLHWGLLALWGLLLLLFMRVYRDLYQKTRLVATACTNVLLFGISDIIAQCITCFHSHVIDPVPQFVSDTSNQLLRTFSNSEGPQELSYDDSDTFSVFNEYGITPVSSTEDLPRTSSPDNENTVIFEFPRWLWFMGWGAFVANFQVPWYKFLNFYFTEDPSMVQVFERVLCDQLLYSPLFLYFFFTYSNYLMEGGNAHTMKIKIQKLYISTLGCNLLVWPLAQIINFSIMPKHFQVPFSSSVGVLWNCFLSMRNASNSI